PALCRPVRCPIRDAAQAATFASAPAPSSTPLLPPLPGDRADRGGASAGGAGQLLGCSPPCPPPSLTIGRRVPGERRGRRGWAPRRPSPPAGRWWAAPPWGRV